MLGLEAVRFRSPLHHVSLRGRIQNSPARISLFALERTMTTYQTNNPIKAHGIWALGIAAMRSLNFKAKALIIFLVFWIPMLSL